jgi:hypothetical protein
MPEFEEYLDEAAVCCDDVECVRETPAALLVRFNGTDRGWGAEEAWVPKSQVHDESEVYASGGEGRLVVTRWFAEQRGWA